MNWQENFEKQRTEDHFDIPDGYFDTLEESVMKRWEATGRKAGGVSLIKRLWPLVGVAAAVLLIIVNTNMDATDPSQIVSAEELKTTIIEGSEIEGLWSELGAIDVDIIEDWLLTDGIEVESVLESF